jgi:hypothetical protein
MARTIKEKQMGRPINKRHFGTPDTGLDIKCRYNYGTLSDGWIVKQVGSKRFKCTNPTGNEYTCTLADKAEGSLGLGEMSISVLDSDNSDAISRVTKITGRRVTLNTGVQVPWDFVGTGTTVKMEEAGTDSAMAGAEDLES